jgi:serine phosphatase RsbU (regulator of sigma subunit)
VSEALERFDESYRAAFDDHQAGNAIALELAYELGRSAMREHLSILDVGEAHHGALAAALARDGNDPGAVVGAATVFLRETLSAFELAHRSFADAHEAVQLEQRHAAQLRRLAEAALAINTTDAAPKLLQLLTDEARSIVGTRLALTSTTLEDPDGQARAGLWRSGDDQLAPGTTQEWLGAPLTGREGRSIGLVQVADKLDGVFTAKDQSVLLQLAQVASVALENLHLYQREHRIAATLQRSLLPPPTGLPQPPGLRLAVRYQPGGDGSDVGGDFYDAVLLPGGRLAVAVGDVVGRGVQAAAIMGQVRLALRALAVQDRPPADVLASLDRVVQGLTDGYVGTVLFLVLDAATGDVRFVNAGHPPPLLLGPGGGHEYVAGGLSPPLGVMADPSPEEGTLSMPPGSTLLLYTDGLVEERGTSLDDGMARLARAASAAVSLDVDALCDAVLSRLGAGAKNDDIALVGLRRLS